jgi:hypothetical protein
MIRTEKWNGTPDSSCVQSSEISVLQKVTKIPDWKQLICWMQGKQWVHYLAVTIEISRYLEKIDSITLAVLFSGCVVSVYWPPTKSHWCSPTHRLHWHWLHWMHRQWCHWNSHYTDTDVLIVVSIDYNLYTEYDDIFRM